MTKIVYNACYGGFSLSTEALELYAKLKGTETHKYGRYLSRSDPVLIQVVEQLGERANGRFARLQIEELAPGTLYRIDEYDGAESVMRQSDYVWSVA
jgi:hypothetical protein